MWDTIPEVLNYLIPLESEYLFQNRDHLQKLPRPQILATATR